MRIAQLGAGRIGAAGFVGRSPEVEREVCDNLTVDGCERLWRGRLGERLRHSARARTSGQPDAEHDDERDDASRQQWSVSTTAA